MYEIMSQYGYLFTLFYELSRPHNDCHISALSEAVVVVAITCNVLAIFYLVLFSAYE